MEELWSKAQTRQSIIERSGTKFNSALDMDLAMRDAETRLQSGGGLLGKKGLSIGGILGREGGENNTNNSMTSISMPVNIFLWKGALETVDFMPLNSADPVGGTIITDWYSDEQSASGESVKISIRFLTNEVRSDALDIKVFSRKCNNVSNCIVKEINDELAPELKKQILKKATLYKKENKSKDKN